MAVLLLLRFGKKLIVEFEAATEKRHMLLYRDRVCAEVSVYDLWRSSALQTSIGSEIVGISSRVVVEQSALQNTAGDVLLTIFALDFIECDGAAAEGRTMIPFEQRELLDEIEGTGRYRLTSSTELFANAMIARTLCSVSMGTAEQDLWNIRALISSVLSRLSRAPLTPPPADDGPGYADSEVLQIITQRLAESTA